MIKAHLPKGLKIISLFEDFNDEYVTLCSEATTPSSSRIGPVRIADPAVSTAFAYRSLELEQLYVSFLVDAQHFFQARQPLWTWNHLQSLVLTSRLLFSTDREISDLLQDAGTAALYMPKLQVMALWNYVNGCACSFSYRREGNKPSITWRDMGDTELEPRVIQAWEKVASKHPHAPYELEVERQLVHFEIINSHADAIHQLDLPRGVLDPVSLWQIQREN